MFKKTMKKIACGVLATASVVACLGTFTACETSHPEATITIEFNGETYTLDYKLYRKIAPSTVNHFIWLAENDYYTDLCIHDYDASAKRMYTGAYKLDDNELTELDYFKLVSDHKNVGNFSHSVWDLTDAPTYTLYGEFEDNAFKVTNGALKETYGSLTMYYHDKNIEDEVYVKKASNGDKIEREYRYNSATSMFFISTVTSATKNSNYCTFATLEDGKENLEALEEAIADYISDNYEDEDDFVTSKTVAVDKYDPYVKSLGKTETFNLPNEPIIIKSVKITKY